MATACICAGKDFKLMTLTTYADGRKRPVRNSSHADALEDLREEFPDMVTHNDGHRTLVWRNDAEAENDDGLRAVAQLTIAPE